MNDIFVNMNVPQLGDPNFQSQFESFCGSLVENIQRLISVQYTKGEPGNSVFTKECTVEYTVNTNQLKLSTMGRIMVEKIFSQNPDAPTDWGWDGENDRDILYNILSNPNVEIEVGGVTFAEPGLAPAIILTNREGQVIGKYTAIPALLEPEDDPTGMDVKINVDPVKGEAYLASPYLFIDGRIAGLNRVFRDHHDEEYYKTFHDYSVAVYGKGTYDMNDSEQDPDDPTTWGWVFELVNIVPKLYFDQNINEFCWEVNGQQTGITAQGVKGDDGITPNVLICIGEKNGGQLNINKILYVDEEGNYHWALKNGHYLEDDSEQNQYMFLPQTSGTSSNVDTMTDPDDIPQPKDNDLALVFFDEGGSAPDPYDHAYLGKVFIGAIGAYVVIGYDEDGRPCDIFEAIKNHDLWELMMQINENIPGSPRGLVIPAEPVDDTVNPSTTPEKTHMMYSERGSNNEDNHGYAKLHIAPVAKQDTHGNREDNPSHHIGDMQVDYNMDVKGDMQVQGALGVQGNTNVQNIQVHNNATVQGNLQVQGNMVAKNITITGEEFPTQIGDTHLACVSKFKDVSYTVSRDAERGDRSETETGWGKVKFKVDVSGVLELNIGKLSKYENSVAEDLHDTMHNALGHYVNPNWCQGGDNEDYKENTESIEFDSNYNNLAYGQRQASKLYDVITYNIPFSISKSVSQMLHGIPSRNHPYPARGQHNIYYQNDYEADATTNQDDNICYGANSITNPKEISIKCCAFRGKKASFGKWSAGVTWEQLRFMSSKYWKLDVDTENLTTTNPSPDMHSTSTRTWHLGSMGPYFENGMTQGFNTAVGQSGEGDQNLAYGLTHVILDCVDDITPNNNNYSINGSIKYSPENIDINYSFDFFIRILEQVVRPPYFEKDANQQSWCRVNALNFTTIVSGTPVGCLYFTEDGTSNPYMVPIWNAFYTRNMDMDAYYDKALSSDILSIALAKIEPNWQKYTLVNYLFKDEYTFTGKRNNSTTDSSMVIVFNTGDLDESLDGPVGDILKQNNVYSPYMISTFERFLNPNDGVQGKVFPGPLKTACFDLTPNIMVVSNNVKVCPNNIDEGWFGISGTSDSRNARWKSHKPLNLGVIPYKGYIGDQDISDGLAGCIKAGVCSPWTSGSVGTAKRPFTLLGVLRYPFTPCLLLKTLQGAQGYEAPGMRDEYNDAIYSNKGKHYIETSRMMGINTGDIMGMVTSEVVAIQNTSQWNAATVTPVTPDTDPITPDDSGDDEVPLEPITPGPGNITGGDD